MTYPDTQLFIAGEWTAGEGGETIDVLNPATGETIGRVAKASTADLDRALDAAAEGFRVWRRTSAFERGRILRRTAEILRAGVEATAAVMTQEQGKPLAEARTEILLAADLIDWFAEEGRRVYGRLIPARAEGVRQMSIREPVGPVAAFTPWNFPISQIVRKLGPALASGCSVILKAPEETPASPAALIRAFAEAGLPAGVLNLVYGVPSDISEHLVPHPVIRKLSFTGSVPVGKRLASLAGLHMKKATMELGGHAPAIIFDDADIERAATALAGSKYRNAGQVCVSPTRFLVQEKVYGEFVDRFTKAAAAVRVGDGLDPATGMGPLVSERRLQAVDDLVADARRGGAEVRIGGERIGNKGSFYRPTVLAGVDAGMRIMNEEPFGPVALMRSFTDLEEAVEEANRLPFGLASYAFARSAATVDALSERVESGMITVNHIGLALPETPFGGMKDSGYGSEGGTEAMDGYLVTKFVTHLSRA